MRGLWWCSDQWVVFSRQSIVGSLQSADKKDKRSLFFFRPNVKLKFTIAVAELQNKDEYSRSKHVRVQVLTCGFIPGQSSFETPYTRVY